MPVIPRWKLLLICGLCLLGGAFAAPNLLPAETAAALPSWLPRKQINLGLDLRGGSHLLLEVDSAAVARERLENFAELLREQAQKDGLSFDTVSVSASGIALRLKNADDQPKLADVVQQLSGDLDIIPAAPGELQIRLSEPSLNATISATVDQALEIIRRRIDETGVREPTIQRQGRDRILVQLPGVDDPARMRALIGKTAKMTFHLVESSADPAALRSGRSPPGTMLLPLVDRPDQPGEPEAKVLVRRRVLVSGESLVDAQPTFNQNEWQVSFRFDSIGAKRFGEATTQNVGRQLAIVLDNQVISAPVIREPIIGGSGVITGRFTVAGARDLALLLRAGALPAPLQVLEERTVGPGLGADSIAAGQLASIVAVALVSLAMIILYGIFGVFAVIALFINLVLIVAILSLFQATLTLPGIAGIVLTMGVAVDANVLIFERIREEVRDGRTPIAALDRGFGQAMSAIIDANLTTMISTALLYLVGSGPVRGFAVTLFFGTLTSMFTAVSVTRLMVFFWMRRRGFRVVPI